MRPELSVVVPVHDVETYLGPCLASLGRQQDAEPIEVVVVDDGSTDSSAQIAARGADAYEGFRLVHQEHQGVSAARNRGVAAASGRYLAFCDADDVVPDDAYSALLDSLRATGSDRASGDVRRLDSRGVRPHPRYRDVFARRRQQTHITTDPELLLDRMPWNKVFRRDFWDRHELRFSLPLYEDAPVMIRAHLLATKVDVLTQVVYHWRVRETGPRSITQRLHEPANVAARMTMAIETGRLLRGLAPGLFGRFALDVIGGDVRVAVDAVADNDDDAIRPALDLAREFVAMADDAVLHRLPARDREIADLVAALDLVGIRRTFGVGAPRPAGLTSIS